MVVKLTTGTFCPLGRGRDGKGKNAKGGSKGKGGDKGGKGKQTTAVQYEEPEEPAESAGGAETQNMRSARRSDGVVYYDDAVALT